MSEQEATTAADDGGSDFAPITSQEALDKIIGQRIARVKNQFSDYDELKQKAGEYDQLQQANKSELEKLQERLSLAETQLNTERLTARRAAFAADKGVPAKAITGDSEEEWQASVDELIAWKGAPKEGKPRNSSGLKSGATNSDSRLDPKERAAAALRQMRST